jgi:hypothetical protein
MKSVSPRIASLGSAQVTGGYFGDLAAVPDLRLTAITTVVVRYIYLVVVGM